MDLLNKITAHIPSARRVRDEYGISIPRQVSEILHLSRGPGKIGPGDYYSYRLFEDSMSMADKESFVGWRAEPWLDSLNERTWHCLGLDKVLMSSLFQNNGIRSPETRAIYLPGRVRPLLGATPLTTRDELYAWLRTPSNYPFFSKPSASGFAKGAFFADSFDATNDVVLFKDGSSLKIDDFESRFYDIEHLGYLFQAPIQTDSRLVDTLGKTVSSLRMVVLMDEFEPPVLHRCLWKLPTGANTHDNYEGGRTGNLAAAVDHQTGTIVRVISGFGLDVTEVSHHPDTGVQLSTVSVPDWSEVVDFTFRAALLFPKLRFQQWDISLSDQGPMALEVNLFGTGGCTATQLIYGKGLLDETMKAFLSRRNL